MPLLGFRIIRLIFFRLKNLTGLWIGIIFLGFFFAPAKDVLLDDFFQRRNYQLNVEELKEVYKHESGLVWEFQSFNRLFKVDKYIYFFNGLPILKDNRIHISSKDSDFLKKVVTYFEERKGISPPPPREENKKIEARETVERKETVDKVRPQPPSRSSPPPQSQTKPPASPEENPSRQHPSTTVEEISEMAEETIDDLYSVDKSYKIDYVFIDPGHGGRDPGATFYGYVEKDLSLSLSQELATILNESHPDFKVVLIRNEDNYLTLEERCAIANQTLKPHENGIFISVHLNVWVDPAARGIEVFYLSGNEKVIQNKAYYHLEDLAGAIQGYFKKIFSYLKVIQYQMESRFLSYQIIKNITSNIKASTPRGYKEESFYVLKGVLMPAVLLELGFISNREDMELLNDKDKRKIILQQISSAVIDYTKEFKESNGFRDDYYFDKFLSLE